MCKFEGTKMHVKVQCVKTYLRENIYVILFGPGK